MPRVRNVTDSEFLSTVVIPISRAPPAPPRKIQPPSLIEMPASILSQWFSASHVVPYAPPSSSASESRMRSRVRGVFSRAIRSAATVKAASPPLKSIAPRP